MATTAELVDITLNYQDQLNLISANAGAIGREIFLDMPGVDRALIDEFIEQMTPLIQAGQAEAHDLTTAWLSEVVDTHLPTVDLRLPLPKWDDPFLRSWHELKVGKSFDEARQSGAGQAEAVVVDSTKDAAVRSMGRNGLKVVGYRRVPSAKACEWCQVVATQRYRTARSAHFGHHSCKCTVVAIFGKRDPGQVIAHKRLDALKQSGAVDRASAARALTRA